MYKCTMSALHCMAFNVQYIRWVWLSTENCCNNIIKVVLYYIPSRHYKIIVAKRCKIVIVKETCANHSVRNVYFFVR